MKIKIDHVNLTVKNLEESLSWYKNHFDMEKVEEGIRDEGKWAIVAKDDSMVCMYERLDDRKSADDQPADEFHRIYHFGVRITDPIEWEKRLEKFETRLKYKWDYPHSTSWYVYDPTGYEIDVSYSLSENLQFPNH